MILATSKTNKDLISRLYRELLQINKVKKQEHQK